MEDRYKIVRMFFKGGRRTIKTGLTLEQAQEHCRDAETSSRTATSGKGGMVNYGTDKVSVYVQTDPRGCAVYILRPGDVPQGSTADCCYTNGIAVA